MLTKSALPTPTVKWTVWKEFSQESKLPFVYVRLDVGQYSFKVGKEHRNDFTACMETLIGAITMHAVEKGWIAE